MLKQAMACDYEGDALLLAKAVRKEIAVSTLMEDFLLVVNKNQCHLLLKP